MIGTSITYADRNHVLERNPIEPLFAHGKGIRGVVRVRRFGRGDERVLLIQLP